MLNIGISRIMEINKMTLNKKHILLETAAIQIFFVLAYLWAVPVIESLDSYTYGTATRGLIMSFLPFVIGVIAAVSFPNFTSHRKSRCALILGCVLLSITVIFYVIIHQILFWDRWFIGSIAFLRILGFALLGYGLKARYSGKKWTFKAGMVTLIVLYGIYNLLIWGMNNVPCQYMALYRIANMAYGLVRIAIVVALWKTLSADSVTRILGRSPKISMLVAGLFWGMFFVIPANKFAPLWLAVLMLALAPAIAYVWSVLVRFALKTIAYTFKGLVSEKFWWKEVCCWWRDDKIHRIEEKEI